MAILYNIKFVLQFSQQGKLGCIAYLREFVEKFNPSQRTKLRNNEPPRDSKKLHRVTMEISKALNSESEMDGMFSPSPPEVGLLVAEVDDDVFSAQLKEASDAAHRKKAAANANAATAAEDEELKNHTPRVHTPRVHTPRVHTPRSVLFEDETVDQNTKL